MSLPFRHTAAFGKRIEYYVIGLMLRDGLDVYMPLVDDDAIDAVVKRPDGRFVEVQIKARSRNVAFGDGALFSALTHELRENYWFVFYSERMDKIWIMSSNEFVMASSQNRNGKNVGKRSIWFNGKNTRDQIEHCKPQFEKYLASNFHRIAQDEPDRMIEF